MKLKEGKKYDENVLVFRGWSNGDTDIPGYNAWDYFDQGVYLGEDENGIEPEFDETKE